MSTQQSRLYQQHNEISAATTTEIQNSKHASNMYIPSKLKFILKIPPLSRKRQITCPVYSQNP